MEFYKAFLTRHASSGDGYIKCWSVKTVDLCRLISKHRREVFKGIIFSFKFDSRLNYDLIWFEEHNISIVNY